MQAFVFFMKSLKGNNCLCGCHGLKNVGASIFYVCSFGISETSIYGIGR